MKLSQLVLAMALIVSMTCVVEAGHRARRQRRCETATATVTSHSVSTSVQRTLSAPVAKPAVQSAPSQCPGGTCPIPIPAKGRSSSSVILKTKVTSNIERPTDCKKSGHDFTKWYKHVGIHDLPEQPAHHCTRCGHWQNISGRFMELVAPMADGGSPGGQGKLPERKAAEAVQAEILRDVGSWDAYEASRARSTYGK